MAITTINLSDAVTTLVTKTNTISTNLGDVATLVTGDTNVVAAINNVRNIVNRFDESAEIIALAREAVGITGTNVLSIDPTDSAVGITLTFDSATGRIGLSNNYTFDAGSGLDYDDSGTYSISDLGVSTAMLANTSVTNGKVANNTLTSSKFNSVVSLQILDSTGTAVKTLYSPGS